MARRMRTDAEAVVLALALAVGAAACQSGGAEQAGVDPTVDAGVEAPGEDAPATDPPRPGGGGAPAFDDATYVHATNLAGPDGASGQATVLVDLERGTACADVELEPAAGGDVAVTVAAHLHRDGYDAPVADLPPPRDGESSGCVEVGGDTAQAVVDDPTGHVVDVHVDGGGEPALQGRLERATGG